MRIYFLFGKQPKDPKRVQNLITSLRHSSLNMNFASEDFKLHHSKISDYINDTLADSSNNQYFGHCMEYIPSSTKSIAKQTKI